MEWSGGQLVDVPERARKIIAGRVARRE